MRLRTVALVVLCALSVSLGAQTPAPKSPYFVDVYWDRQDGAKTRSTEVTLEFNDRVLSVWKAYANHKKDKPLFELPYESMKAFSVDAQHETSAAAWIMAGPMFATSNVHRLTVTSADGNYTALRLLNKNYALVIAELEKHSTLKANGSPGSN